MAGKSAKDLKLDMENLKIYALGGYGTGKSVFASTFPTPGFVFDFDQRIKTYRGRDWDYESFPMTFNGWIAFEKVFREVMREVKEGKYKTVVLDSTSSMTDTAMERALQIDPKRSATNGPLWNVHYQIVKNLLEPKLHTILSFPCHVVVIGHWDIVLDSNTGGIISIDPLLTGNLSTKVPGYFDEVYAFFSEVREGKEYYFFRTLARGFYKARSTISGPMRLLPAEIPNNFQALEKHMRAALEKEVNKREEREQKLTEAN